MILDSRFTGDTNVRLVPGSLYGLRAFSVRESWKSPSQPVLCSPSQGDQWLNGEMVASCAHTFYNKNHVVGSVDCSCGFYSYYTMGRARTYLPDGRPNGLLGVIEAYGRVTVGDHGMRSEKARVVGFVVPQTLGGKVRYDNHKAILEQFPEARTFRTLIGAAMAFDIHGRPKIKA